MDTKLKWTLFGLLVMPLLLVSCSETKEEPLPKIPIAWSIVNNSDSANINVDIDGFDVTVHACVTSAGELVLKSADNDCAVNFLDLEVEDRVLVSYSTEWYDVSFENRSNDVDTTSPFLIQEVMHIKFNPLGDSGCFASDFEVMQGRWFSDADVFSRFHIIPVTE